MGDLQKSIDDLKKQKMHAERVAWKCEGAIEFAESLVEEEIKKSIKK